MNLKVVVCPKGDLGPLSPNEEKAFEDIVEWFTDHTLRVKEERINTTNKGWLWCALQGATVILLESAVLRGRLGRFQAMAYPWVPPGEMWPGSAGGDVYHTHWRLDFRAMNPLEEDSEAA